MSCNDMEMFPASLCQLKLEEFYFERNPLITHTPIPTVRRKQIFQLRVSLSFLLVVSNKHKVLCIYVVLAMSKLI